MPPGRRPSAWEVSFPELANEPEIIEEPANSISQEKRKDAQSIDSRLFKRRAFARAYYEPKPYEIVENENLTVIGEDFNPDENENDKPIRILSHFSIFNPDRKMEMVSLEVLDNDTGDGLQIEGAGYVMPHLVNEEDEGQEDGIDDDQQPYVQYVRLRKVDAWRINYLGRTDPIYIETSQAWYILKAPSRAYKPLYLDFYRPHRLAQLIVSYVHTQGQKTLDNFLTEYVGTRDVLLDSRIQESDVWQAASLTRTILEHLDRRDLIASPLIRKLFSAEGKMLPPGSSHVPSLPRRVQFLQHRLLSVKNIDLTVLQYENQNPTVVTPFIHSISSGLFEGEIVVVGPPPAPPKKDSIAHQKVMDYFRRCRQKVSKERKSVNYQKDDRLKPRSAWVHTVTIEGEIYHVVISPMNANIELLTTWFQKVNDTILLPTDCSRDESVLDLPDVADTTEDIDVSDFFWFAKIISLNGENETAHVQWFIHSKKTVIEELGDAQELFLTSICDTVSLHNVVGKVTTHRSSVDVRPVTKKGEFFYKFNYDKTLATFTDIDPRADEMIKSRYPPDNCSICSFIEQEESKSHVQKITHGISLRGVDYHLYDFVLFKAEESHEGPCHIGQLVDLHFPPKSQDYDFTTASVRLLGRVSDIPDLPSETVRDKQHLFLSNDIVKIPVRDFMRLCFIAPSDSIPNNLSWLESSSDHFFVKYQFPSSQVKAWTDRQNILPDDFPVCMMCYEKELKNYNDLQQFNKIAHQKPIRIFDPFAGIGAFALGMQQAGVVKLTHAIEISPSAAQTLKHNAPGAIVYNQCANTVLRYAIKTQASQNDRVHKVDKVGDLLKGEPLPPPPTPGNFDCIITGFPCQPHSRLNMFVKAEDRKSSLILNVLSWVDYLRPAMCIFENVRGFLQYRLTPVQAGRHRVEGGINQGGLKLVIRALIAMNYQVRFALLQAGHYGTPQSRVRLFILASKQGHPLPDFPQPTHDFPVIDGLQIKFGKPVAENEENKRKEVEEVIRPIRTRRGTAPYSFVSVEDAISDLPRFDWKHPRPTYLSAQERREARERQRTIPSFSCDKVSRVGYNGVVPYHHPPRTRFQQRCREIPTQDLQHFTRNLLPLKIERVLKIPLLPGANYRTLKADMAEWQLVNPSSATSRLAYRPTFYARLDKDGWFGTTVTNIEPTAKQSKVLNPYCKRMLTVRELARSQGFPDNFVFKSVNSDVVTMHRQIGNAVPWPLSFAIGRAVRDSLFEKWVTDKEDAIEIDD